MTFVVINNSVHYKINENENKFITVCWYPTLIQSSEFDHSVNFFVGLRV